jgi:APA family basic amino acid/polyamine antiporter
MIPIAGSAYTYSYATMGELVAWIIGWDLVLEYALGAATVGIAWSEYLNKLLGLFGVSVPFPWCHSPFQVDEVTGAHGIINLPAIGIVFVLTLLLIRGISESALVNGLIVVMKVTIVILIIILGWSFIRPENHTPYIPPAGQSVTDAEGVVWAYGGWRGIIGAAGIVFFAFIGFDAVSTAAQEAKNPARDMPIGILGSLAMCTVLYILFAHVLTGIEPVEFFRGPGREASVAKAIDDAMHMHWLSNMVTVAILGGFSSVILVMLLGQSRVFYSMSRDGLVPAAFSQLHPKYRTPYKSNLLFFGFVGLFAAFIPGDIVGDMTSIGTLFAFILVSIGVWVMRVKEPTTPRPFRVPAVQVVSVCGALVCGAMIFGLGWPNWTRLGVWLVIGLAVYFGYGVKHSKLQRGDAGSARAAQAAE